MSIASQSEIETLLGLTSPTAQESAQLALIWKGAEASVRNFLTYDPEQATIENEKHQRCNRHGGIGQWEGFYYDVNPSHTAAIAIQVGTASNQYLQTDAIPIRHVSSLYVDYDAKYGAESGAFGGDDQQTEGDDFYVEYQMDNYCPRGHVYAIGGWPTQPGNVKLTYVAGYSPAELSDTPVPATSVSGGVYSTRGVDASLIRHAVHDTVAHHWHLWQSLQKTSTGWTPGTLKSEKLGDYSYTLGDGGKLTGSQGVSLTPRAKEMLQGFVHYGHMVL